MADVDVELAVFSSFGWLSMLLLAGKFLRTLVPCLRQLYLPSSVIGGFLGLALGYVLQAISADAAEFHDTYFEAGWKALPGILINAIFGSVFIGVDVPPIHAIWDASGPQIAYGQVVTHGLWALGLLVGYVLSSAGMCGEKCPSFYGMMLYVGFEGGHGTVGGLEKSFNNASLNWTDGKDVCLVSATVGLVGSTLVGVMFVNIAMRRKWLSSSMTCDEEADDPLLLVGIYSPDNRPAMGHQTVASDSIDTLSLHAALLGLAIFFGYLIKRVMTTLQVSLQARGLEGLGDVFGSFPLFPLCMLGGIIVQLLIKNCVTVRIVDHHIMQRISGLALDYLVCAAIAKMELSGMAGSMGGLLIILGVGVAWHCFCLLVLAKPLLPDAWFERGIFEVGHSMGTTANGILLLKMADKRGQTAAHSATAFKLVFHEPFMGVWLAIVVATVGSVGPLPAMMASFLAMAGWLCLLKFYFLPRYPRPRYGKKTTLAVLTEQSSRQMARSATMGALASSFHSSPSSPLSADQDRRRSFSEVANGSLQLPSVQMANAS